MSKKYSFVDENGEKYEDWKQKNLGQIAERVTRKNKNNFSERNLTISGELGLIDQLEYFTKNISSRDNSSYYLLHRGEFAYNKSYSKFSPYGATKKLHRYEYGAVSPLYICFRITSEEVYDGYLEYFFDTETWGKELMSIAVEGARNHGLLNVAVNDFFTLQSPLPSPPEQKKIAEFFSALDERIALTADKVKLLKEQKQGYLQQVFNRELVFTDDNGDRFTDWEEKRLGDVADLYQPQTISGKDLKTQGYPVYGANGQIGFYDKYNHESEQVTVTCRGNTCGTLNYTVPFSWITGNAMVINPFVDQATKRFLFYCMESINFDYIVTGSGQPQITRGPLASVSIKLPSLPEQEKIAEFFLALDEQIELTENKLTLLKEQKKGYLQGIFG